MTVAATLARSVMIVLSLVIGFFFIFVGIVKLTPAVNGDIHREMRKEFVRLARVFPLAQLLGLKVDPHWYRNGVGALELVCGIMLSMIPGGSKQLANLLLFATMIGALYSLNALHEPLSKMLPAIVTGLLLIVRYVLYRGLQSSHDNTSSTGVPRTKLSHKGD